MYFCLYYGPYGYIISYIQIKSHDISYIYMYIHIYIYSKYCIIISYNMNNGFGSYRMQWHIQTRINVTIHETLGYILFQSS